MRNLLWQYDAWDDYQSIQTDKAMLKKVNRLLKDLLRNGYKTSYGKVEIQKRRLCGLRKCPY